MDTECSKRHVDSVVKSSGIFTLTTGAASGYLNGYTARQETHNEGSEGLIMTADTTKVTFTAEVQSTSASTRQLLRAGGGFTSRCLSLSEDPSLQLEPVPAQCAHQRIQCYQAPSLRCAAYILPSCCIETWIGCDWLLQSEGIGFCAYYQRLPVAQGPCHQISPSTQVPGSAG